MKTGRQDPALEAYFREINRLPMLSRQEELELARRAKAGDEEATKRLVEANLRFVIKIAYRYINQGLPLIDLISAGNEGLIIAARHFEPERGNRLISYAVWWIRQSISRVLANDSRTIRLPFYVYCDLYRLKRVRELFRSREGREPNDEDLSGELGLPPHKVERLRKLAGGELSLNRPLAPDDGTEMLDLIADAESPNPEDDLLESDRIAQVEHYLSQLPERQARIVSMHYGIGCEPMTLREIGKVFNLSRERIRQIEVQAFRQVRKMATKEITRAE
jgi:RNA polymerase primary sigma factor